jgi:hypothetical protein
LIGNRLDLHAGLCKPMLSSFVIMLSPLHLSLIFAFVHCSALLSPSPRDRGLRAIHINMTTPKIDTNQWYQLYVNEDKSQSLLGTSFFTKGGTKGAVFFNTTNTTLPSQRWQIFPVTINSTTAYTIRSKDSGPNGFMGTAYSEDEDAEGKTRPSIFRGDVASNNVYWSFDSWGDGTSFLINTANGAAYHLNKKGNGIMNMSPNISAPQNGQRWGFATIDKIDDEKYSSVNVRRSSNTWSVMSITDSQTVSWSYAKHVKVFHILCDLLHIILRIANDCRRAGFEPPILAGSFHRHQGSYWCCSRSYTSLSPDSVRPTSLEEAEATFTVRTTTGDAI